MKKKNVSANSLLLKLSDEFTQVFQQLRKALKLQLFKLKVFPHR
jgi:hypothetical protein